MDNVDLKIAVIHSVTDGVNPRCEVERSEYQGYVILQLKPILEKSGQAEHRQVPIEKVMGKQKKS